MQATTNRAWGNFMATPLTAQDVFNGPGWDDHALLLKAERELGRLRTAHNMDATDHMFNFAVTLAAVCDWTFHLHLSHLSRWSGKKEQNFTHWLRNNCADVFVFIDIANEYKHANRNTPSALAEKMMVSFIDFGQHPEERSQVDLNKGWIQQMGTNDWFFFPSIKYNGRTENFYDPALRAIAWWRSFTPTSAVPMDARNNILP